MCHKVHLSIGWNWELHFIWSPTFDRDILVHIDRDLLDRESKALEYPTMGLFMSDLACGSPARAYFEALARGIRRQGAERRSGFPTGSRPGAEASRGALSPDGGDLTRVNKNGKKSQRVQLSRSEWGVRYSGSLFVICRSARARRPDIRRSDY